MAALVVVGGPTLGTARAAPAQILPAPCDPSIQNKIVCENSKPGNPSCDWDVSGAGDPSIQGFATDVSVNVGDTVHFKIKTDASAYRLDIYRMGYYGGAGARKLATVTPSTSLPQTQPACLEDVSIGLIDCGNWAVSAMWAVPDDAVSGIYFAKLVRSDTSGASHIFFVVRDDNGLSDILFQTSDTTWLAYNGYGGASLHRDSKFGLPFGRAYKVSYNRPFMTRESWPVGSIESWVFSAEYPMVRWLEANGYDVSYLAGADTDRRGHEIREHKVFLSVGHDEYWSAVQRANVEAARDAGVHLAFFSGNEVFWKIRWENSVDGSNIPYRTMVCYKETHANAKIDPDPTWTGAWRDRRFSPPADGGRPENALTGTLFMVDAGATAAITVPARSGQLRFWRNTALAAMAPGQTASLPFGTLGYTWDEDLNNGFRPAGLIRLSSTTVNVPSHLRDNGSTYGAGTATHSLTLYRHSSGALVFGAGTVQWSWGLDSEHDVGTGSTQAGGRAPTQPLLGALRTELAMQQATANLLADMGVQPGTLQPSLTPAVASTDTTAPTSTISSPAAGSMLRRGRPVAIVGTAADTNGIVAGVEVSVDGGTTWHLAAGWETWSYMWTPTVDGEARIKSRAADDSGNVETSTSTVAATVQLLCPCSIWDDPPTPNVPSFADDRPVEVGVSFRSDVDGYITGVRFYKGPQNTGSHVGHLWTSTGNLLASVAFTNETASGWQQAIFVPPVPITANTTYVASYYAPDGRYAVDRPYFVSDVGYTPIRALADGKDGPNGLYKYGSSGFPTETFQSSNYWVDVLFTMQP